MRFLLKMPTRERPQRAYDTLDSYFDKASGKHSIFVQVNKDNNDDSMIEWLDGWISDRDEPLHVITGSSANKIHACNRDMEQAAAWDIMILVSDDMICRVQDWDDKIVSYMLQHFPNLDGALWINDGHREKLLCTLVCMGYNLYTKFGYLYHPDYWSLWADNEYQNVLTQLGRLEYVPEVLIEHDHWSISGAVRERVYDSLYERNEKLYVRDQEVYFARKERNFDLEMPMWSILICSLPHRSEMLADLLLNLNRQINNLAKPIQVEIVIDNGNLDLTIGAKRNEIMKRARGKYVSFIDDDDQVSTAYVSRILAAMEGSPDCVALDGIMTWEGVNPQPFYHSVLHNETGWQDLKDADGNKFYVRTPNHWNAVRRDLAIQVPFPDINWQEDKTYSDKLRELKLLNTEGIPDKGEPLYFYRYSQTNSEANKRRQKDGK